MVRTSSIERCPSFDLYALFSVEFLVEAEGRFYLSSRVRQAQRGR
jgi:hypothetical protein